MAKTLHDRFCEGLEALGMKHMVSSNKYTMFQSAIPHYYFVGANGALLPQLPRLINNSPLPVSRYRGDLIMNELIWRRDRNQDIGDTLVAYTAGGRLMLMDRAWFNERVPPNFITPAIIADIKAILQELHFAIREAADG